MNGQDLMLPNRTEDVIQFESICKVEDTYYKYNVKNKLFNNIRHTGSTSD